MRRTRIEHILSALPPLATEERTFGIGSSVPQAVVSMCNKVRVKQVPTADDDDVGSLTLKRREHDSRLLLAMRIRICWPTAPAARSTVRLSCGQAMHCGRPHRCVWRGIIGAPPNCFDAEERESLPRMSLDL